jgi:hypothetical protein
MIAGTLIDLRRAAASSATHRWLCGWALKLALAADLARLFEGCC